MVLSDVPSWHSKPLRWQRQWEGSHDGFWGTGVLEEWGWPRARRGEALAHSPPQWKDPRGQLNSLGSTWWREKGLFQQERSGCGRPLSGLAVCLKAVTADEYSANSVNKDLNQKTNRALTILWLGLVSLEGAESRIESGNKCTFRGGRDAFGLCFMDLTFVCGG